MYLAIDREKNNDRKEEKDVGSKDIGRIAL